jgi:glycosyltransferase involved in cell wall biosynthesis
MISIIIPIYKVENYIERCARSLFEQTFADIEYIFVDDCSPDNSISILKNIVNKYPDKANRVKIITHSTNQGVSASRNSGLNASSGEYIYQCDGDDYIEKNLIEKLYFSAKDNNADIVWCDWFLSFSHNERYMKQPEYDNPMEALKGILLGSMKYNLWNKLVKRSLYTENGISFPICHNMGEDMTMIRLFACAKVVAYVPEALYHYVRLNENSYTNAISKLKLDDIRYNTNETISFLQRKYDDIDYEIACFKLNVKFPFLIVGDIRMYRLWLAWFPEANQYIMSNKSISLRSRLLQYAASKRMFLLVWLYYKIVHKFIYGIIYK